MASLSKIAKMDVKDISLSALKRGGSGTGGDGGDGGRKKSRRSATKPAAKPAATRARTASRSRPRLRRGPSVVGLDVQPGYIAAVQASVNGVVSVERAVGRPLPAETMREGEVLDEELLASELRELFREARLGRQVRVGLANQRTIVRVMELPPITDRKEMEAAVRFQAADQIPMPLASAVLDFHPLGIVETPSGHRQRVVVVAAQRDMVEKLVRAVSAAGLKPIGVDLSAFAMIRALHRAAGDAAASLDAADAPTRALGAAADGAGGAVGAGGIGAGVAGGDGEVAIQELTTPGTPGGPGGLAEAAGEELAPARGAGDAATRRSGDGPAAHLGGGGLQHVEPARRGDAAPARTLYLNVGGLTNMAIAEGVTCRFTRTVGGGLESMAADLAQRHTMPLPDARAMLAGVDLTAAPGEEGLFAEAHAVLSSGVREIAGEVRNSLDFHRAQESGGIVESIVLSGSALEIAGFAATLEAELGSRVSRRIVALGKGGDLQGVSAERLTVAAGLAVEEVGP